MELRKRKLFHGFLFFLGLVLMVAGIATGKNGAMIIGLIVAAIKFQLWHNLDTKQPGIE
jgi:hypothetical protein